MKYSQLPLVILGILYSIKNRLHLSVSITYLLLKIKYMYLSKKYDSIAHLNNYMRYYIGKYN